MRYVEMFEEAHREERRLLGELEVHQAAYYRALEASPDADPPLSREHSEALKKWSAAKDAADKIYVKAAKESPDHPAIIAYRPFFTQ